MAFGCSICHINLDQSPTEDEATGNAGPSSSNGVINISATPCGHIFHTYCIQKWLSGDMSCNKLCPFCRKEAPKKKCLLLYPTAVDNASPQVDSSTEPCNQDEKIADLKDQVSTLEKQLKEERRQKIYLSGKIEVIMDEARSASYNYMMQSRRNQQWAHDLADRAKRVVAQFDFYKQELQAFNAKLDDIRRTYDSENCKLKSELEKKNQEYQQLQSLFNASNYQPSQAENLALFSGTNTGIEEVPTNSIVPVSPMTHENEIS